MSTYSMTWEAEGTARECLAALAAAGLPYSLKVDGAVEPGDILDFADERLRVAVIRLATEAEMRETVQRYPGPNVLRWPCWIVMPLGIDHLALSAAAVDDALRTMEAVSQ